MLELRRALEKAREAPEAAVKGAQGELAENLEAAEDSEAAAATGSEILATR